MPFVPVAELKDYVGKELGKSEWLTIDQQRINQFAECTGDHQFIHVDPEKAKLTPSAPPSPTVSCRCRWCRC